MLITLSAKDEQNFGELVGFLKELKALSLKSVSPIICQEFLSQKFSHFEAILHKNLIPLLRISSLSPTVSDAPPAFTGVQGGEKIDQIKFVEQVKTCEGMKTTTEDAKVVGKIYPSKVVAKATVVSAGPVTSTVITTVPIPKPISKGVVIGERLRSGAIRSKHVARMRASRWLASQVDTRRAGGGLGLVQRFGPLGRR
ncbi:unnamed protein product [Lactuca saligna]|uniref:Uncharacterized protein n=1 Tax=Lactuca saligna TaxID=75948 RepID=A0AA35YNM5_LACSI|nr:unnamed protein product [Lactuca saligna]